MLSPDLTPDLQCVASDVPFYETGPCKKEMSYYNLQPMPSHQDQYTSQSNNSLIDFLMSNSENDAFSCFGQPWQTKPPAEWTPSEVFEWLLNWSKRSGVSLVDINMRQLNEMSGQDLCRLTQSDFMRIDPNYGKMLHQSLHDEIAQHFPCPLEPLEIAAPFKNLNTALPPFSTWPSETYSQLFQRGSDATTGSDIQDSPSSSLDSDREDPESPNSHMTNSSDKRSHNIFQTTHCGDILEDRKSSKRGRPSKGKGNGKLWEFIRDLLLDPETNPSLIRWERPQDGIFKFVQSDRVAKMWGERKQNSKMTYEKLSRAMRNYYNSGILEQVPKGDGLPKQKVYKFGSKSSGWREHV